MSLIGQLTSLHKNGLLGHAYLCVGDPLAELRHEQLNALQLPRVGYGSAIDLGVCVPVAALSIGSCSTDKCSPRMF